MDAQRRRRPVALLAEASTGQTSGDMAAPSMTDHGTEYGGLRFGLACAVRVPIAVNMCLY